MNKKRTRKNTNLVAARESKYLSQERLAHELGTTQSNISRWEQGRAYPDYYYIEKLCTLFGKTREELGFLRNDADEEIGSVFQEKDPLPGEGVNQALETSETLQEHPTDVQASDNSSTKIPTYWLVPYERNPYFIDRDIPLEKLEAAFLGDSTTLLIYAISGLPGVGKTQVAVEYAYRYMKHYQAVFWFRADESGNLIVDFTNVVHLLDLPEKTSNNQNAILHAVWQWLSHNTQWLLIFDNVERLEFVTRFLPVQGRGHILLTTRMEVIGKPVTKVDLNPLEVEEAATFLLRRADIIQQDHILATATSQDQEQATALSMEVDGLPLALDQAGAYIEELSCPLSEYLDLYHAHRKTLLQRRGERTFGHPDSMVATVSLALAKIEALNPAAKELLFLYAFLSPDNIPQTILRKDTPDLGFQLQTLATHPVLLHEANGQLSRYALIRHASKTSEEVFFHMHRLVQSILKDLLEGDERHRYAEQAVRVVNRTVASLYFAEWHRYHHYIAHAQVCVALIKDEAIVSEDAAQLLSWVAGYLHEQGQYTEAEALVTQSLTMLSKIDVLVHQNVLENINQLATIHLDRGQFEEAEKLYHRALASLQHVHGQIKPLLQATLYNNLGELYTATEKNDDAESFLTQALHIRERMLGSDHELVAVSLYCLAELYSKQGKYSEAGWRFQRALEIREQRLEVNHGSIAESLNGIGANLLRQQRYEEAEIFFATCAENA